MRLTEDEKLNQMMGLDDSVIQVLPDGTFRRYPGGVRAPEVSMNTDDDGQILKTHDAEMMESVKAQGWDVQTGWTGQYSYSGPLMHESEYIGGRLAEHIRETPGLWCVLPVYVDSEECPNGSDTCKLSEPCMICYDGTGSDREQMCAGWILANRDVPVELGENEAEQEGAGLWRVFRDGEPTGTNVVETRRGYHFHAPRAVTPDGKGHRGPSYPFRDDARKDAEEWLTQNLA